MSGRSRIMAIILIWILLISTAGCWNRREPENLAHALGIGFDIDDKTGLYKAYVQFSNPQGSGDSSQSSEKGSPSAPAWTVSAEGRTPYEAIFNTVPFVSRELSVAHVGIVIISERLAQKGIGPILDLLERERTLRTTIRPLVAKGDIGELMTASLPLEEVTSLGISRGMSVARLERSILPAKYVTEVIDTLAQPGKEPLLPKIEALDNKDAASSEKEANQKPPLKAAGGAVFRSEHMVGWMDEREIRGWSWLTNNVGKAIVVIDLPAREGEYMTVIISQASSKLKAIVDGDDIRFELKLSVDGRIEDQTAPIDLFENRENVGSMNRRIATVIRNDIEKALTKAQSLGSDVFGLGWLLYRTRYKDWLKVEERWDEIFPLVSVDMDIRVDVRRSGLITKAGAIW